MKFVHNYGNRLLRSYFSRKFYFPRMNWTDEGTQLVGAFGKIEGELRESHHVSQDTVLSKICGSMQRANRFSRPKSYREFEWEVSQSELQEPAAFGEATELYHFSRTSTIISSLLDSKRKNHSSQKTQN